MYLCKFFHRFFGRKRQLLDKWQPPADRLVGRGLTVRIESLDGDHHFPSFSQVAQALAHIYRERELSVCRG